MSAPVERFVGRAGGRRSGRQNSAEIFSRDSQLGTLVLDAFDRKSPLLQREFVAAGGRRVQVSLDFVQEKGTQIGPC